MSVIFLPEIRNYFNNLIPVLYEKEYFGHKDSARRYVDDLYDDITTNLFIKCAISVTIIPLRNICNVKFVGALRATSLL